LPQDARPADSQGTNAPTAVSWQLGGIVGVGFEDSEGLTTGPLLGFALAKPVNRGLSIEGQLRVWVGRPVEGAGRDSDYENKQWMGLIRVVYVHGSATVRPLVAFGGGWDRIVTSTSSGEGGGVFALPSAGVEVVIGRLALRPEFAVQVGPGIIAPQLSLGVVYSF